MRKLWNMVWITAVTILTTPFLILGGLFGFAEAGFMAGRHMALQALATRLGR